MYKCFLFLFLISFLTDRGGNNIVYAICVLVGIHFVISNQNYVKSFYKVNLLPFVLLSTYFVVYFTSGLLHIGFSLETFLFLMRRGRWLFSLFFFAPMLSFWIFNLSDQKEITRERLCGLFALFFKILAPLAILVFLESLIRFKYGLVLFGFKAAGAYSRASWTYNAIPFSQLMVFFVYFSLSLSFFFKKQSFFRRGYVFLSILFGVNIILSQTRASWVALILSLPILLYLLAPVFLQKKSQFLKILVLGLIIVGIFYKTPSLKNRMASIQSFSNYSNKYRMEIWKSYGRIIKGRPWFGIGYRKAWELHTIRPYLKPLYQKTGLNKKGQKFYGSPHNEYLDILSGVGVLGFFPYLLFLIWLWFKSLKVALWFRRERLNKLYVSSAFLVSYLSFIYVAIFFDVLVSVSYSVLIFCFSMVFVFDRVRFNLDSLKSLK